ncbi:MAG: CDP-alcohol phosphatidyltransferase family protein [Erythrobacter sp.]
MTGFPAFRPAFRFASARTANRLVAGVPAAARLARSYREAGVGAPLVLVLADGRSLAPLTMAEIARLAPGVSLAISDAPEGPLIAGESLPEAAQIPALLAGAASPPPADPDATLAAASRAILRATAKPGDGIVSRHLNRPVSQACSALLLRLPWIRPGHATVLTALCALAMIACLALLPGEPGLVTGAVLFQLASIVDGIDGEIARATFRTSPQGASWDSAVDAVTNLGFLFGLVGNLWFAGRSEEAMIGLAGLAMLVIGMSALGLHARARGEPLNFDGAKRMLDARPSPLRRWLRYVTMRDFYCLFLAVMIVAGLVWHALAIFAGAAALWLVTVTALLLRAGRSL